jgi:hypothetical protein
VRSIDEGTVTVGATSFLVVAAEEIEPGIRELRCASALRPYRDGDTLLSVYAHVLPDTRPGRVYRSVEEARTTLKVVPLRPVSSSS